MRSAIQIGACERHARCSETFRSAEKWVIGVGIALLLAVGGMIVTATEVLLRVQPHV
jgi:hypothetical protein